MQWSAHFVFLAGKETPGKETEPIFFTKGIVLGPINEPLFQFQAFVSFRNKIMHMELKPIPMGIPSVSSYLWMTWPSYALTF